jgi:hypothetical protein
MRVGGLSTCVCVVACSTRHKLLSCFGPHGMHPPPLSTHCRPCSTEVQPWQQQQVVEPASDPLPSSPVVDVLGRLLTGPYARLQAKAGEAAGVDAGAAWRAALDAATAVGAQQIVLGEWPGVTEWWVKGLYQGCCSRLRLETKQNHGAPALSCTSVRFCTEHSRVYCWDCSCCTVTVVGVLKAESVASSTGRDACAHSAVQATAQQT